MKDTSNNNDTKTTSKKDDCKNVYVYLKTHEKIIEKVQKTRQLNGTKNIYNADIIDFAISLLKVEHLQKIENLEYIKNKLKVKYSQIYFVDDQVRHLEKPLKHNVNCFLAAWGYTTPQQRALAKKLKVPILKQGDLYKCLTNT